MLRPVINDHSDWKVEKPEEKLYPPIFIEFKEVYTKWFGYAHPHMNFAVTDNSGKGVSLISIQKNPTGEFPKTSSVVTLGPTFKGLMTDDDGYEEFYLHNVPLQKGGIDPLPVFEDFLASRLVKKEWRIHGITSRNFVKEMLTFEQKFSRRLRNMKIAVLYIKPGQKKVKEEIFQNRPPPASRFFRFMDIIASRVDMKTWKGYRGDMGKDGEDVASDSYFTTFQGINIMFHIAPFMQAEQHRRLVGNDIAVLIFFDNPDPTKYSLDLFGGMDIGIVPHTFGVVEPHPTNDGKYRLAFFSRPTVPSHGPPTPPFTYYFKADHLKTFLFTKLHNGYVSAQNVPPMNRLYTVPRREAIAELVEKYPKGKEDEHRNTPSSKVLKVKLISGTNLASKDKNGLSDPYCRIIVGEEEFKSKVCKKTLSPNWNEEYEINLVDEMEEFHIVCFDWDQVGAHDYMGEYRIMVCDIPSLGSDPVWLPLFGTTTEEVSGKIRVQFQISVRTETQSENPDSSQRPIGLLREKMKSRKKSVDPKKREEFRTSNTYESSNMDSPNPSGEGPKKSSSIKLSKSSSELVSMKSINRPLEKSPHQKPKPLPLSQTESQPPPPLNMFSLLPASSQHLPASTTKSVGTVNNKAEHPEPEDQKKKGKVGVSNSDAKAKKVLPKTKKRTSLFEDRKKLIYRENSSTSPTQPNNNNEEIFHLTRNIMSYTEELISSVRSSTITLSIPKAMKEDLQSLENLIGADANYHCEHEIVQTARVTLKSSLQYMKLLSSGEQTSIMASELIQDLTLLHQKIESLLVSYK